MRAQSTFDEAGTCWVTLGEAYAEYERILLYLQENGRRSHQCGRRDLDASSNCKRGQFYVELLCSTFLQYNRECAY